MSTFIMPETIDGLKTAIKNARFMMHHYRSKILSREAIIDILSQEICSLEEQIASNSDQTNR